MDFPTNACPRPGVPEFSELVLACRHRLWQALAIGIVGSLVFAASAYLLTPATYEAKSLVRVRQHQDVVLSPQSSRADDLNFVRAQEQIALSPQVLSRALQNERLVGEPRIPTSNSEAVRWLSETARVDLKTGSEVMTITALHPSAELAHALSLSITEAYLNEVQIRSEADRTVRREKLQRAAKEAESRLGEVWEKLNGLAAEVGSDSTQSLTIRDEIQLQAYRDYSQQLRAAQFRGNELERRLADENKRKKDFTPVPEAASVEQVQQHPETVAFRQRIAEIDLQIDRIRDVAADPDSPRIARLREVRQSLVQAFEKFASQLTATLVEASRTQPQSQRDNLVEQLTQQIELNKAECDFLSSRMSELEGSIVRTEENNGVQLDMSRHEIERQSRLADSLWQALEELKIESQSQQRVSLIEPAEFPLFPNRSRQIKAATACFAVAWILTILGIGFLEWRSCRIRTGDDVRQAVCQPTFGAIDLASGNASQVASHPAREVAARIMLLSKGENQLPSLLLSSATNDEPRFLVSIDLARAFSSLNCKTILIDCDNHSNKLSKTLSSTSLLGMRQLNTGISRPADLILRTSMANLDYLPSGFEEDSNWLDPKNLKMVIAKIRQSYDAIVVNGPAIYGSSDGLLMAAQTDFTILAAFANVSRWDLLAAIEQTALASGVSVFGTIISKTVSHTAVDLQIVPGLSAENALERVTDSAPGASGGDQQRSIEQELRDEIEDMRSKLLRQPSMQPAQK